MVSDRVSRRQETPWCFAGWCPDAPNHRLADRTGAGTARGRRGCYPGSLGTSSGAGADGVASR
jgi:hypothetical protein